MAQWELEREVATRAARAAGEAALRFFRKDPRVTWKPDDSPVSEADHAADRVLVDALRKAFPADAILTEETGELPGTTGRRWIIDPIDGTRPFLRGIPDWSNLVALESDGDVVVGVLNLPAHGDLYAAARGLGTTKNDVRVALPAPPPLDQAVVTLGQLANGHRMLGAQRFQALVDAVGLARGYGDARGPAMVLSGFVDACLEFDVSLWDLAPFPVLFEEAGATYTDLDGVRRWPQRSGLAAHPRIHPLLLEIVKG